MEGTDQNDARELIPKSLDLIEYVGKLCREIRDLEGKGGNRSDVEAEQLRIARAEFDALEKAVLSNYPFEKN